MEFEGYCVKCHKKQPVKDGTVKEAANGRRIAQGTCSECGTKVNRFLPSKKVSVLATRQFANLLQVARCLAAEMACQVPSTTPFEPCKEPAGGSTLEVSGD